MAGELDTEGAGDISRILSSFPARPSTSDEQMAENVRSSLQRTGLRTFGQFKRHSRLMSVAAGGPSLADTYQDLSGDIVAVNGSQAFLQERGITPWATGILDPGAHMVDIITANPDVIYFVASCVDPAVFDKLQKAGCEIVLWHAGGPQFMDSLAEGTFLVGGGSTMGLRWLTLGHCLGYRKFSIHGMDSSFRGVRTHAYPDRRDGEFSVEVRGRFTSLPFLQQVIDFLDTVKLLQNPADPVDIQVHGEGLLQDVWRET